MDTILWRKREQKFCVANDIVTNNLRGYYMERFRKLYKYNIRRFAQDCGISYTSMERFLVQGKMPRYQKTLEQIEDRLGKDRGDVFVDRELVDWNVTKHTWAHPDRSGQKQQPRDGHLAAEPRGSYQHGNPHPTGGHRLMTNEEIEALRERLLETVPEEYLLADETIRKFITNT